MQASFRHTPVIQEAPLTALAALMARVPEFSQTPGETPPDAAKLAARCHGRDSLALAALLDGREAGFMVSYDRDGDGSFYCWMAGVLPEYRRRGTLGALMARTQDAARARGYRCLRVKTRNSRREMLAFLVAQGFDVLSVEPREPVSENRIEMILPLGPSGKDVA